MVLGVSCDPGPSQKEFARQEGIEYPLLSDFEPKGAISRAYGVYNAERGISSRSAFLIDRSGTIRFKEVCEFPALPDPDVLLAELKKLA